VPVDGGAEDDEFLSLLESPSRPQCARTAKSPQLVDPDVFQMLEDYGLSEALGSMVGPEGLKEAIHIESILRDAEHEDESAQLDRLRKRHSSSKGKQGVDAAIDSGSECDEAAAPQAEEAGVGACPWTRRCRQMFRILLPLRLYRSPRTRP
jgi:hypothetical protein